MPLKKIKINVHSVINIQSLETAPLTEGYLNRCWGPFIDCTKKEDIKTDILLKPIKSDSPLIKKITKFKPYRGMLFSTESGQPIVYFFYKNNVDCIIIFSQPIEILYVISKNIHKRLHNFIMYCIRLVLYQNSNLICHASVLKKKSRSVLFMGPPMIGKSMATFFLLSNGWDFISDDKIILANGTAYSLENFIGLRPHHFEIFPWLKDKIPSANKIIRQSRQKERLFKFASKFIPNRLLAFLEEFSLSYHRINVNTLFPKAKVINKTKLTDVVVFSIGTQVTASQVKLEEIIDDICIIQEMFLRRPHFFEDLISLSYKSLRINYKKTLEHNLQNVRFYQITAPTSTDSNEITEKIINLLN